MILKYQSGSMWIYVGDISKVIVKGLDTNQLITDYNNEKGQELQVPDALDPCEYNEAGEKLPQEIICSNKAFMKATDLEVIQEEYTHQENNLDGNRIIANFPAVAILVLVWNREPMCIVTNQAAYLMNDKGETTERLN